MTMEMCACGKPLHYRTPGMRELVDGFVALLGENIKVQIGELAWLVPRHYIALHGLKAFDLPTLAERLGFPEVSEIDT